MPLGRGLLVFNPAAGSSDPRPKMEALAARLRPRGLDLVLAPTSLPGQTSRMVRNRLEEGFAVVAAAGGDSTVGEVAGALVGTGVPLGVLAVGTTNVVAREYGLGGPAEAAEYLLSHKTRPLAVWPAASRPSVIATGIGFDARVMGNAVPWLKRLFGRTGIGPTAVWEWLRYEFPPIGIEGVKADGERFETEATFVVAANTRRYGGDPILSPHADPGDDLLDLVLFRGSSRKDLMLFYHRLSKGAAAHLDLPEVERLAVREFTATSHAGYPLEVQVDGDAAGTTPVTVGPASGTVEVVVPEAP
jgi:diacylglycerol kinase family enzyme